MELSYGCEHAGYTGRGVLQFDTFKYLQLWPNWALRRPSSPPIVHIFILRCLWVALFEFRRLCVIALNDLEMASILWINTCVSGGKNT